MTLTREQRFWNKVKKADGCWLWLGSKQPRGYGYFWYEERVQLAHRVSFQLAKGPIAEGSLVLHSCDNPQCVNPDHLRIGTAGQNSADMVRRGRSIRGEQCSRSKLTEHAVRQIRAAYSAGCSVTKLAREYEVNHSTIIEILRREIWRHVA